MHVPCMYTIPGTHLTYSTLTRYVDLMGGTRSATFARFRDLVIKGFLAARKHADKLLVLAELSLEGSGRTMPCFRAGRATIDDLRARFQPDLSRRQCARFVDDMINRSIDHWTTTCYDKYQRCWLGIM